MDNMVLLSRNYFINFVYRPKRRTPLASYMRRLSLQYVYPDNTVLNKQILAKTYTLSVLHIPSIHKHQKSIKLTTFEKTDLSKSFQSSKLEQKKKKFCYSMISLIISILAIIIICSIIVGVILYVMKKNTIQPINSHTSVLFEFVKNIKAVYYNQKSDIWNNITSTTNKSYKIISRTTRKIPLIILLFSNEITIMDSLAIAYAASSNALNAYSSLCLNRENFENNDEIIHVLKKQFPTKKIMIDNYQLSQEKLAFFKKQIYQKLLNNIDQDTLMAFIVCIIDEMIIPESES